MTQSGSPNVSAMHYGDKVAKIIVENDENIALRDEIIRLWTIENIPSDKIAETINGDLGLKEGISEATASGIIRKVLALSLKQNVRNRVKALLHSNVMTKNCPAVQSGRDKWMKEKNMFVWSSEETEYFQTLLRNKKYLRSETKQSKNQKSRQRRRHFNHTTLAKAMNDHFETVKFTSKETSAKLERIRADVERKKKISKPRSNIRRQLNKAIAVPPLVVIPREGFDSSDSVTSAHEGSESIDDGTAGISDVIFRD